MTNPVRILNSVSPTVRPTGRSPGEPFVNYPDLQFGVVDVSGTAVDLLAVRFFSATAHYNIGDHVLQGGVLYRAIAATGPGAFAPASWTRGITLADATATYLPLAGGTMTGLLLLSGEPVAALGAATKQTVDGKVAKTGDVMTGALTITSSGTAQLLEVISTDPGAGDGPRIDITRNSASPAVNDLLGELRWNGRDSANNLVGYNQIYNQLLSVIAGSESSLMSFQTRVAGVTQGRLLLANGVYTSGATGDAPGGDMGDGTINARQLFESGVALASKYAGLGTLVNVQRMYTSGQYVPTPGATKVLVILQAGGGGGGGVGATVGTALGGNADAGECRIGVFPAVPTALSLGAPGNGGGPGNVPGSSGTQATFGGNLLVCGGGAGGLGSNGATSAGVSYTTVGSGGIIIPNLQYQRAALTNGVYMTWGSSSWFGLGGFQVTGATILNGATASIGGGGGGAAHAGVATTGAGGDGGQGHAIFIEFK